MASIDGDICMVIDTCVLKRFFSAGILLAFISSIFCFSAWAQGIRVPKLYLQENAFNSGEVMEGEIIRHAFPILNKGNDTLQIMAVKPG